MIRRPPRSPLFPYPTLFRFLEYRSSEQDVEVVAGPARFHLRTLPADDFPRLPEAGDAPVMRLPAGAFRSEEHTSELQSQSNLLCRLLLEKKKQDQFVLARLT